MALGDLERQILIRLRAEGEGVGDRIKDELARLYRAVDDVTAAFSSTEKTAEEWKSEINSLSPAIKFFENALRGVTAAAKEMDPELQRLQATLQAMGRRDAENAAEAAALSKQTTNASGEAWRQKVADAQQARDDLAALHAALQGMDRRDAENAVEAAALSKQSTNSAMEAFRQRVADAQQGEADLAALHARLQQMERGDAEAAAEALDVRKATAREGAQAVLERVRAIKEEEQAEAGALRNAREIQVARAQLAQQKREALEEEQRISQNRFEAQYHKIEQQEIQKTIDMLAQEEGQLGTNTDRLRAYVAQWEQLTAEGAHPSQIAAVTREVLRLEENIKFYGEQAIVAAKGQDEFNQSINAGASYAKTASTQIDAVATTAKRYNQDQEEISNKSKEAGYAILHLSHAFQDLQYSWAATLNNIPLIVTSMGGGAGLAGTLMAAGVGAQMLSPQLGEIARQLDLVKDPANKVAVSLADLDAKIKALEERPHKILIDYQTIEYARQEVAELKKGLEAFESVKSALTPTQQEMAKMAKEAITEFAGGTDEETGAENLAKAIRERLKARGELYKGQPLEMNRFLNMRAEIARYEDLVRREQELQAEGGGDPTAMAGTMMHLQSLKDEQAKLQNILNKVADERIRNLVGQWTKGSEKARQEIQKLVEEAPAEFEREGIGPEFRVRLQHSSAKEIREAREFDEEAERVYAAAQAKKERDAAEDRRAREEREFDEEARRVYEAEVGKAAAPFEAGEHREKLRKDVLEGIGAGRTDEEIAGQLRPGLAAAAREAGVPPMLVEDVARKVLADELRKVRGDLAAQAGPRPEAAAAILAEQQAKEREKAEREREAAIRPEVERIIGAFGDELGARFQNRMAENLALAQQGAPVARSAREEQQLQGMPYALPPEELAGRLAGEMERIMTGRGATPEAATEAARRIAERGGIELTRKVVATPAQEKVASRQQAEAQRQEKARLREANRQRPAAARRFKQQAVPAAPTMGWRGAVASALVGAVPAPEPVRAPTPEVQPPEPVVIPPAEVIPAPPIAPPAPEVIPPPAVNVPTPEPVQVPTPEVEPPPPVSLEAPEIVPPPPVEAPTTEVRPTAPVRVPAPDVSLAPPAVPAPAPVATPGPEVVPAGPVTIPAPDVSHETPVVPAAPPVRAGAPEVLAPPPVRVPGTIVEPGAPEVLAPSPVRATAPEVLPPPPLTGPAPRVAASPPVLDVPPPVRLPAPRVEQPPPVDVPPIRVPAADTVRIPPPIVEGSPVAMAPRPRVMVPPPDIPPTSPVRIEAPPVIANGPPPGRNGAAAASPMGMMGAVLQKGADADHAVMSAMSEQIMAIQQLAARLSGVEAMAQQNAQQARRMRVRQPSLLPTLGFGSL